MIDRSSDIKPEARSKKGKAYICDAAEECAAKTYSRLVLPATEEYF